MFQDNLVTCAQGILRGEEKDCVTVFRGVPFAQPPVGDLRWRAPQPPHAWKGIRPAVQFSAMPVQRKGNFGGQYEPVWQSEDCLYLNIWTPASGPEEKLPIFVWFYGGSYQGGRADDPSYDGTGFAKNGVITVTVNYRVGVLGFLCHPDMRKESAGGNFGLLDQIAALEWIRDNIAAFGGDPAKVTIGGQSAGSASVNNLMCSPKSRGLIRGAINQSGDVFQPERDITFDEAAQIGVELQKYFGCTSLDGLRELPADQFTRHDYDAAQAVTGRGCTPVIDGVIIPEAQGNMLLRGKAAEIPILIGTNADEGSGGGPGYVERVTAMLGLPKEMYPQGENPRAVTMRLARDYWYGRHLAWVKIRTENLKLPTWQYVFARKDRERGAQHGMEIPFVFRTLETCATGEMSEYTTGDYALMDIISGYWTNFIKTGNPNGEGLPGWDAKAENTGHMRLDLECRMEGDYFLEDHPVVCPAVYKWMKGRAEG